MHNEFLGDRRKALEEEYFAKLNRALLERLRAASEANTALSPASGSAANSDIKRSAGIGTDSKSLAALSLAPLVAMAWAEAGVDDKERSMVLSWAAELGLTNEDPGYRSLEEWLAKPPTPELLAAWKRDYVGALSLALTQEARRELKTQVLGRARAVAQATGAFSGIGQTLSSAEQAIIEEIESALR